MSKIDVLARTARSRPGLVRGLVAAAALGALAVPMLTPTPAEAWWARGGWGGGWGGGCCWRGGGAFIGIAPPVVVAPPLYYAPPPPVYYAPPPVAYYPPPAPPGHVWVQPHWEGNAFIPGHWG